MGHQNTQFPGHMIDLGTNPQACFCYGGVPHFPQPDFTFHHPMSEHHESTLFYGTPPHYNTLHPQHHPSARLDLAVGAPPSTYYNPYSVPLNHTGAPTPDSYARNIDGVRGSSFKMKNAEGGPGNYQYFDGSGGSSSSSIGPMTADSDTTMMMVESGSHRSVRNGPGMMGPDMVHNGTHLAQGNYTSAPVQVPGNPWFDMRLNEDMGTFAWTQAPNIPFVPAATVNGACVETGNIGIQVYQNNNTSSNGFVHPPSNPHHPQRPVQGVRGYNGNFPSSSRRISTITTSNNEMNPFQNVVESGPTFLAPVPPTGFRFYQPHRREIILDANARYRPLPHLRDLREDEVAILEIPGYHEAGNSIDQHLDMRLDIDHMSYEELLALGEQIGSVGTGLNREFIQNYLKTRTFISVSSPCINLEEAADQRIDFCVICQTDYIDGENIGTLDCGHEYHRDCIKKWLHVKNTCPVCKSTALSGKERDL